MIVNGVVPHGGTPVAVGRVKRGPRSKPGNQFSISSSTVAQQCLASKRGVVLQEVVDISYPVVFFSRASAFMVGIFGRIDNG